MKLYSIIILQVISLSCSNLHSNNKRNFDLRDKDGLEVGKVTCALPNDFDTTYTWISASDCMCCDAVLYRSHSKAFNVVKETGFLSSEHLFKGFYFTISHYTRITCDTQNPLIYSDLKTIKELRKRNIEGFVKSLQKKSSKIADELLIDTSHIINNNTYDIYYYSDFHFYRNSETDSIFNKVSFDILTASTQFRDRNIGFSFWNNIYERDSFYLIAMNILKSITIE